jgi:hypothetical protein
VLTVRNHEDQFRSHLQQEVKYGFETEHIVPFLYSKAYEMWHCHFPTSLILAKDKKRSESTIPENFLRKYTGIDFQLQSTGDKNISPSSEVSHLLQMFNKRYAGLSRKARIPSIEIMKELLRLEPKFDTTRARLTHTWSQKVRLFTSQDKEWLEEMGMFEQATNSRESRFRADRSRCGALAWHGVERIYQAMPINWSVVKALHTEVLIHTGQQWPFSAH